MSSKKRRKQDVRVRKSGHFPPESPRTRGLTLYCKTDQPIENPQTKTRRSAQNPAALIEPRTFSKKLEGAVLHPGGFMIVITKTAMPTTAAVSIVKMTASLANLRINLDFERGQFVP
jgi:hypothetical protein